MFKPSELPRWVATAAVIAGLLAASISAIGGVIEAERQREAAPAKKAPPVLLLRCWQEGRLLFEEPLASVPADARKSARLTVIDRNGQSLHVIDMTGATCLVRSTPAEEYRGEGGAAR